MKNANISIINRETYEAVELLSDAGIEISVADGNLIFKARKEKVSDELMHLMRSQKSQLMSLLSANDKDREDVSELPLTELQQSYWIGGSGEMGLDGADRWYNQFASLALDVDRLAQALQKLIARHDYLRSYVTVDGYLKLLDPQHSFSLEYEDFRGKSPAEEESALQKAEDAFRTPMEAHRWPLYKMIVQQFDREFRVHVGGRLLIGDAASWHIYANELGLLLENPSRQDLPDPKSLSVSVLNRFRYKLSRDYQQARSYWTTRSIPPSPVLPVRATKSRFTRLVADFEEPLSNALVHQARDHGMTLDCVFIALYALVLDRWSQTGQFSINILHGNLRHAGYPLGHFGSILRLQLDVDRDRTFIDLVQSIRKQFLADMAHGSVDGIKVQRLASHHSEFNGVASEVAYSSGLGLAKPTKAEVGLAQLGWEPKGSQLQTPGVVIDFQVFFTLDGIRIHLDIDQGRLGEEVSLAIFDSLCRSIRNISKLEHWNNVFPIDLPESQLRGIALTNQSKKQRTIHHLHGFVAQRLKDGEGVAIVTPNRSLSYSELAHYIETIVADILNTSFDMKTPVVVAAQKGWQQVTATVAVVCAGGIYVPIDPAWPLERIVSVINRTGSRIALVDRVGSKVLAAVVDKLGISLSTKIIDELVAVQACAAVEYPTINSAQLAYIIFTSGSTGEPKGVAISHDAVANTIEEMLDRFSINNQDSVLGVSGLHFDLSVFDIFAVLGAGGTLVLPNDRSRPDPEELYRLASHSSVTIWNTVPAVMEMLAEFMLPRGYTLRSLRYVFLSGDWIPLDLPEKLRAICPNASLFALGGATEASIWSNWFEIKNVPSDWKSIPYGKSLANQALYVTDRCGIQCPDWVEGDLLIGGDGLAQCYWNLPEESAKRFKQAVFDEQRIYLTGDRARRWPDGTIEFLGRADTQIKVNGYRIELGEIVSALKSCRHVENATAIAAGMRGRQSLTGFVTPDSLDVEAIREELLTKLPTYMLPAKLLALESIPLTENGKVNNRLLLDFVSHASGDIQAPETPHEIEMARLWQKVLNKEITDCNIGFFQVGGDSILAVRLINMIEKKFSVRPSIAETLQKPTIRGMVEMLGHQERKQNTALVPIRVNKFAENVVLLVHPVGGTIYCYKPVVDLIDKDISLFGVQSIGLAAQEYSLVELAEWYVADLLTAGILPDHILGWSFGGIVAGEMQRILKQKSGRLVPITMVDPWVRKENIRQVDEAELATSFVCDVMLGAKKRDRGEIARELSTRSLHQLLKSCGEHALGEYISEMDVNALFQQFVRNTNALMGYPPTLPEQATIWNAMTQPLTDFPYLRRLINGNGQEYVKEVNANHYSILFGEPLRDIVATLTEYLD